MCMYLANVATQSAAMFAVMTALSALLPAARWSRPALLLQPMQMLDAELAASTASSLPVLVNHV